MAGNRGKTTLKSRRRASDPMRDYDGLPAELRAWVARANLQWGPKSVRKSYDRALAQTGDPQKALAELDRLQARLVSKDAKRIWGQDYPCAEPQAS